MPAMLFTSTDLPAPLSPRRAVTSPARTSRSTFVRACTGPNAFEIPRKRSRGSELESVLTSPHSIRADPAAPRGGGATGHDPLADSRCRARALDCSGAQVGHLDRAVLDDGIGHAV